MSYLQGYEQGKQTGGNPFTAIMSGINDATARRLSEDKKRREEERSLKDALTQLGIKYAYDDALARTKSEEEHTKAVELENIKQRGDISKERFKKRQETQGTSSLLKELGLTNNATGEQRNFSDIASNIPEGMSVDLGSGLKITGKQSAEEKGREKSVEESFTRAEGIKRAARRLASITNQFNKALPQEQKGTTTTGSRVSGFLSVLGAKTGAKPNPELLALQDTAKLQLRGILRDMGEGARMSDQDISQNLAVIEQAGLSNAERKAKVKSFLQVAVDSMDSAILDNLKKDSGAVSMFKEFGVNLNVQAEQDTEYQKMLSLIGQ